MQLLRCKKLRNYYQDPHYFSQSASFVLISGTSEKRLSFKSLSHPRCPWSSRHHAKVCHQIKDEKPSCPRQVAFGTTALAIDMGTRTDYVHSCHLCRDKRSQEGCAHLLPLLLHLSLWLCGAWLCFLFFARLCQGISFKHPGEGKKMVWLWIEVV